MSTETPDQFTEYNIKELDDHLLSSLMAISEQVGKKKNINDSQNIKNETCHLTH